MNLRKIAAAGLTSALLVGLLGIGGTPAVADDTYATVSGKITLDGKPVKGASVSIRNAETYGGSAVTDASGAYSADWVEPGTYYVVVDNYGYDPVTLKSIDHPFLETYSGNTVREPDAKYYTVTAGSSLTVDVKLVAGATIKGKVVNSKGKPVAGATVSGSNTKRTGYASAQTDAQGRYELLGHATGPVSLYAYSADGKLNGEIPKVSAVQGKTVTAKTVVLKSNPVGTITATVKGLKKGDSIYAYDTKAKWAQWVGEAKKSTFKVKAKVAPGTYRIVVGGQNIASKAVTVKAKKTSKAGTLKASKKRTKVTGVVKASNGKKLANATVWVSDSYGTLAGSTTTNKKGKYSVSGVVSGKYTVDATDPSGKSAWTTAKLTVKKGSNAKKNIKLGKTFKVTGTVKYAGKAVAGVWVYGGSQSAQTGASGKFTLKGIPKGKQYFFASDPFTGGYLNVEKSMTIKKNAKWNVSLKK